MKIKNKYIICFVAIRVIFYIMLYMSLYTNAYLITKYFDSVIIIYWVFESLIYILLTIYVYKLSKDNIYMLMIAMYTTLLIIFLHFAYFHILLRIYNDPHNKGIGLYIYNVLLIEAGHIVFVFIIALIMFIVDKIVKRGKPDTEPVVRQK
jgi:hypothetical protein